MNQTIDNSQDQAAQDQAAQDQAAQDQAAQDQAGQGQQHQQTYGAPRRLTRPRDGRMVGGVCQAVARYSGVDVTVIRLVAVASCLFGLTGAVLYVAGLLLIPQE